jgi:S-adenosylmethionine synthetase
LKKNSKQHKIYEVVVISTRSKKYYKLIVFLSIIYNMAKKLKELIKKVEEIEKSLDEVKDENILLELENFKNIIKNELEV